MSEHNAFLMIPAYLVNHPDIDDATAIFFGRLNALSNQFGYCFASDKYLAEICKCGDRVITDRIKKLKNLGFIRVVSYKVGMKWERKIWTCNHYSSMEEEEIQISSTKGMAVPHRRASACPIEGHGGAPYIDKRYINKKENHLPLPSSEKKKDDDDFSSKSKKAKSRKEDLQGLLERWKAEGRPEAVINATLKAYEEQPIGKVGSITSWMEKVYTQKFECADAEELYEIRRKFAENIETKYGSNYYFVKHKDLIAYTCGSIETLFDIKGVKKGAEDFWEKNKLGKQAFVQFKQEQRSSHVASSV